jgi:uncharacterized membrane protein YeaQ/YmgE (transglycosylase-associated protein family)
MASVISVILTAFITGALARFAVPGPDPLPDGLTVVSGVVGSLRGAGIVVVITGADPAWMGISGFLCAITLVILYRRFVQKRALWGPDAYRFPDKGFGVEEYRERLSRAGIDPDAIGQQLAAQMTPRPGPVPATARAPVSGEDPTENPAHYLRLLDELHDSGVLVDEEYTTVRTRLLERLRA